MAAVALCEVCEERGAERVEGAWFCPQCCLTLCPACHHTHLHCPALADHRLLDIRSAPSQPPAWGRKLTCPFHEGKQLELYCPDHQDPLCVLCANTSHQGCLRKQTLPEAAQQIRADLKDRAQKLKDKDSAIGAHTDDITNDFKAMKIQLQDTFRDLHKVLNKRQEDLALKIQTQEQQTLAALKEAEEEQGGVTRLAACSLAKVTKAAPDGALATMTKSLTSLLKDAENMPDVTSTIRGRRLIFDDSKLAQIKSSVERLGEIKADEQRMAAVALCEVCEERGAERVEGAWFCPQCCLTLCPACHHTHLHCPALADHRLLDIRSAPSQPPAWGRKLTCPFHEGKQLELYCPDHQDPLCVLCANTSHQGCLRKQTLPEAAQQIRADLKDRAQKLKDKDSAIGAHTDDITNDFKAMKIQLQDTFRDLHKVLNKRQEDLALKIQTQEQQTLAALKEAEEEQGGVTRLAACSLAKVTKAAPDGALATMTKSLTSLLKDAENMPDVTSTIRGRRLIFDDSKLAQIKSSVERLGEIKADEVLSTSSKRQVPVPGCTGYVVEVPDNLVRKEGAQLARILKDGGPGTVGTVVHVGAVTVLQGKVKVAWDSGASEWHNMGRDNVYELQLAM